MNKKVIFPNVFFLEEEILQVMISPMFYQT